MTRLGTAFNQSSFRLTYVGSDDPIDFNRSINRELLMAVNIMHESINCMSSEISVFLFFMKSKDDRAHIQLVNH